MMFAADSDHDREDTQAYIAYITEGASSNDRRNGSRQRNQENERGTRVGAAGRNNERTAGNRNETRARKERMEYSEEYSSTIGKDGEREGEEKKRKSMPGSRDSGER
jgi:hypothetical protein